MVSSQTRRWTSTTHSGRSPPTTGCPTSSATRGRPRCAASWRCKARRGLRRSCSTTSRLRRARSAASRSSESWVPGAWVSCSWRTTRSSIGVSRSSSCARRSRIRRAGPDCTAKRRRWLGSRIRMSWASTRWARISSRCSSRWSSSWAAICGRGCGRLGRGRRWSRCSAKPARDSRPRTRPASCTATSSPTTCSSVPKDVRAWPTLGWPSLARRRPSASKSRR